MLKRLMKKLKIPLIIKKKSIKWRKKIFMVLLFVQKFQDEQITTLENFKGNLEKLAKN